MTLLEHNLGNEVGFPSQGCKLLRNYTAESRYTAAWLGRKIRIPISRDGPSFLQEHRIKKKNESTYSLERYLSPCRVQLSCWVALLWGEADFFLKYFCVGSEDGYRRQTVQCGETEWKWKWKNASRSLLCKMLANALYLYFQRKRVAMRHEPPHEIAAAFLSVFSDLRLRMRYRGPLDVVALTDVDSDGSCGRGILHNVGEQCFFFLHAG